jgi:hypothetical protein
MSKLGEKKVKRGGEKKKNPPPHLTNNTYL